MRLGVVCQAYGTDPTGKLPSQMDLDVAAKAASLSTMKGVEFVIFQGGYTYNGGPYESRLMSEAFKKMRVGQSPKVIEETKSLNSLEGARAIREIAVNNGVTGLRVIGESFHIKRIQMTYWLVFRGSGIRLEFKAVTTPFGPNSQLRLTAAWRWWIWEIRSWIATPILYILGK